jgi:hypothetical protein
LLNAQAEKLQSALQLRAGAIEVVRHFPEAETK